MHRSIRTNRNREDCHDCHPEPAPALPHHACMARAYDPLQGTRFTFDSTEQQCAHPQLMTTSTSLNDASYLKAEEI